jgi:hypothetical protein
VHHQIAVKAEILQHVFTMVRVVPVDAWVAEEDAVVERFARCDWILREMWDTVEAIVESQAVPMDGGGKVGAIDEANGNR